MKTLLLLISFIMTTSTVLAGNLLSVFVAPPDQTLDWTSPGSLYRSLLKGRLFMGRRPFGSAGADLVCQNVTHSLSSDTESFDVVGPVVLGGKGLGHLYSAHPGILLTGPRAVAKNKEVMNSVGARFITFLLSEDQCVRIRSFWAEFEKHKIAKNFGLPHRPLMGEGATDTGLVVSTLEVAGILIPDQREKWERILYLPKKLAGPPLSDEYVSFFSVLSGDWGKNSSDSFPLTFWDPELIAKWIDQQIATKKTVRKPSDKSKGIPGIEYDLSKMPVPQGTFWEQANDPIYSKKKN